jgi:hypothetical protein
MGRELEDRYLELVGEKSEIKRSELLYVELHSLEAKWMSCYYVAIVSG